MIDDIAARINQIAVNRRITFLLFIKFKNSEIVQLIGNSIIRNNN